MSILTDELRFEDDELKLLFGENVQYIKIDNFTLLFDNTKITIVLKETDEEGKEKLVYNSLVLKDYLDLLNKYRNKIDDEFADEISIRSLGLSSMTQNALLRGNVSYVFQLEQMTEHDLHMIKTIGAKSIEEVKDKLKEIGKGIKEV